MVQEQQYTFSYLDMDHLLDDDYGQLILEVCSKLQAKERPFFDPESPEILRQRCE